jgi:hypothetical protein
MRRLLLLSLALVLVLAVACGDDDDGESTPTPSEATPTAARTPIPTPGTPTPTNSPSPTPLAFSDFAGQVETALGEKDVLFFMRNPLLQGIECPNELMTECGDGPTPTMIQGIVVGNWRSEAFPQDPNDFIVTLSEYLVKEPTLRAIASRDPAGGEPPSYYAVTAVKGDPKSVAVFEFKEGEGTYHLASLIFAPVLGSEWLGGECAECYDEWEEW